jgi:HSP20 family protein
MGESKITKDQPEQVVRREAGTNLPGGRSLFDPMIPFGDLFGVNPLALMRELTREINQAFLNHPTGEFMPAAWAPTIEVKKADGALEVTAELPGIKNEEVTVEVTDEALVIRGERKREKQEEKEGVFRSERSYGRFYRSLALPEGAKTDQIKAEMKEGILSVRIPFTEAKRAVRQVRIEGKEEKKEEKTAA